MHAQSYKYNRPCEPRARLRRTLKALLTFGLFADFSSHRRAKRDRTRLLDFENHGWSRQICRNLLRTRSSNTRLESVTKCPALDSFSVHKLLGFFHSMAALSGLEASYQTWIDDLTTVGSAAGDATTGKVLRVDAATIDVKNTREAVLPLGTLCG